MVAVLGAYVTVASKLTSTQVQPGRRWYLQVDILDELVVNIEYLSPDSVLHETENLCFIQEDNPGKTASAEQPVKTWE